MRQEIEKYSKANIVFVQEEHKNMGAWFYAQPRIHTILKHIGSSRNLAWVLALDQLIIDHEL